MATSIQNLNPRHPALMATADIIDICKPLTQSLGIDFFCFHRVFEDGSEIMLSNSIDWVKHYYVKNYNCHIHFSRIELHEFKHIIWPEENVTPMLGECRGINKLSNGISVTLPKLVGVEYLDFIGYGLRRDRKKSSNYLISNILLLERFALYFRNKAALIIDGCKKNKIQAFDKDSNNVIKQNIELNNFQNFIIDTSFAESISDLANGKITAREYQCIKYLLQGKTMAEIGLELNLSPRTVETYFEHLKNKFLCQKKSELVAKLLKTDAAKFIFNEIEIENLAHKNV